MTKIIETSDNGYEVLHLYGYYEGGLRVDSIEIGFDDAISIVNALKPYSKNGVSYNMEL